VEGQWPIFGDLHVRACHLKENWFSRLYLLFPGKKSRISRLGDVYGIYIR
jgi:hypothetical protein